MKLNKKGFTLIELLAVITIMGILMLVAIPAVSRTIENSRRDTYKDLVKTYISTVRNAVIADELDCNGKSVGSTTAGQYYFVMGTNSSDFNNVRVNQTKDLMESGGKSSWGNNDVIGMVAWVKEANSGATDGFKTTYYAFMVDSANHGLDQLLEENSIVRSSILTHTSIKYDDLKSTDSNPLTQLQNKVAGLTEDSNAIIKKFDTKTDGTEWSIVWDTTPGEKQIAMTECKLNS